MNNFYIIIIVAVFIIGAVIYGTLFSKKAIVKRKLKKTPLIPISQFSDGQIGRIAGKLIIIGNSLEAPLSGRKCAYYYVLVEQKVSSGKSSHWKTLIEEEIAGNFYVQDGNYSAIVDTTKVKSYIVQDRKYSSGTFHDAEERLEKYLNQHGIQSTGMLGFNKTLRYKEGILEQGEIIAITGKGHWKSKEGTDIPARFGKILQIIADNDTPVYLSDDPDTVKAAAIEESNVI